MVVNIIVLSDLTSTQVPATILPSDITENLMAMTIKPRWGDDLKSDALKIKYEEGKKMMWKIPILLK